MTFVATDGVVGAIVKLHQESPEAASVLYRIGLYEALADQVDAVRPEMESVVLKNMADINATARRTFLRSHVGKAINGEPEPDDLAYAEALAILDQYVSKDLVGWALAAFNQRVRRDERGRFTSGPTQHMTSQRGLHEDQRQRQGAIDLMGLAAGASQRQGDTMTRNLFEDGRIKQHGDQMAADWWGPSEGTNRQSYRRMKLTGEALAGASQPGSVAHTVGSLAELAGNLGPEAEKVLGPGVRRTAYRYRGTERRPERSITSAVSEANSYALGLNGSPEEEARAFQAMTAAQRAKGKKDPAVAVASQWTSRNVTPDKRLLSVRGDAAVAALLAVDGKRNESVLPNLDLVRLSLASGEMPPSQGVIIDERGQVTTQAVGFNGDHYLPFDLRNLNSLHGGQYVRSRATGGPTTEDLYTGLLTGARQIQVVSNSGVFTIEFDPELRGGRRYGDKARRMIDRYGAMLETIGNPDSELFEPGADLPPEEVSALRVKAAEASRTPQEFQTKFGNLQREARMKASFSEADMSEIDEAARNVGRARAREEATSRSRSGEPMSSQQVAQLAEDEARKYKRENQPTVRRLKLDGIGYNQAMQALKQEFPYFIRRADFQPLPEWLDQYGFSNSDLGYKPHAPSDLGFVERGQTNTRQAQTGARRVPTRTSGGAAPAGGAPKEEQPSKPGEAKATATESQQPKQAGAVNLADPNGPMMRQAGLAGLALSTAAAKAKLELPMDVDDEYVMSNFDEFEYLTWKMQKLKGQLGAAHAGQAFANWFINESTPVQRETIRAGLEELVNQRETNPDWDRLPSAAALQHNVDEIIGAYDVLHPYTEVPQGVEPALAQIDPADPKPPLMPGTPAITAPDEDFDYAEKNLRLDDELGKWVDVLGKVNNDERAAAVQQLANDYQDDQSPANEKRLTDAMTAWSYVHTRELRERVKPYLGQPGGGNDAAPLVEKVAARRRLIFG